MKMPMVCAWTQALKGPSLEFEDMVPLTMAQFKQTLLAYSAYVKVNLLIGRPGAVTSALMLFRLLKFYMEVKCGRLTFIISP